jgi:C4-dicarboxylate-specific signal transduction histidine kinase
VKHSNHPADKRHQERLEQALLELQFADSRVRRHVLWTRIKALHKARSKREVKMMERDLFGGAR